MKHIVGISDMRVSCIEDDELVTLALGSCVGITIYDKKNRIGGILHYKLPKKGDFYNSSESFLAFADTGIFILIKQFERRGGKLSLAEIKAAGGASLNGRDNQFEIGKKNVEVLFKIISELGLKIEKSDLGGNFYRTMKLSMKDGTVTIINHKRGAWTI